MGEAKRRRMAAKSMIYHHTSTLRTNLIWMSGVIEVERRESAVIHPKLGEIRSDAALRRSMQDFPALAWFTKQILVPRCLLQSTVYGIDKITGERTLMFEDGREVSNVVALNRVAIGFPIQSTTAVPWPTYRGYNTPEGRELNESAREAGDDPDDWYVSETPVDVLLSTEIWSSPSILNPKLKRVDRYLPDVHRMVRLCREQAGVYIPPTWLTDDEARKLAERANIPVLN